MKETRIRVLREEVARMVAAGEVIQYPVNVVKELVDNAIDAGATSIDIAIVGGGKSSIQVTDNGCGMCAEDARRCFERHATSKISEVEDLDRLHTLGFRGEALASIAACCHVTLTTRQVDDELGIRLMLEGSRIVSEEPVQCAVGTTFVVSNIFYNIPARRRFLKEDKYERQAIQTLCQQLALAKPEVAFSFTSNGQEMWSLQPGTLEQRIGGLYGKKWSQQLLKVESEGLVEVSGYVGHPESARQKSANQQLFVNGRPIDAGIFRRAVSMAYDQLIPTGTKVPFLLFITLDPSEVDVNVSPSKTQVHFENQDAVFAAVVASVRQALARLCVVPTLSVAKAMPVELSAAMMPTLPTSTASAKPSSPSPVATQTCLFAETEKKEDVPFFRSYNHLQYNGLYIITTTNQGVMVTNQCRAHERILFERYMALQDHQPTDQFELFDEMRDLQSQDEAEARHHNMALRQARRHCIVEGQHLTNDEMEQLIGDLLSCQNSRYTPDGKFISQIIPQQVITVNI